MPFARDHCLSIKLLSASSFQQNNFYSSLIKTINYVQNPQLQNNQTASMNPFKYIFGIVRMCDFFKTSQLLRYKNQNQYRTLTGGFFSVAIIITILAGFANMIIQTLNLTTITYTLNTIDNIDPTMTQVIPSPDKNFMFAIAITGLNLSAPLQYFNIQGIISTAESGQFNSSNLVLEQCTRDHWASLPSVLDRFDKLGISNWLCPPINDVYPLYGERSSATSQWINYFVFPCQNGTTLNQTCASQDQFNAMATINANAFQFTLFYIKSIVNPSEPNYVSYSLEDRKLLYFGPTIGSLAFCEITDFTINTDYSIWPYTNIKSFQGYSFEDSMMSNAVQVVDGVPYLQLVIIKSANSQVYTRQVQKISSVFSFMGGLIGAVMALMFIVQAYTGFSYEIALGLDIFFGKNRKQDQGLQQRLDSTNININFFHFIKYYLFSIFNSKKKMVDWPLIEYIYSCRQEIIHHLNISSIVKRLIFLQHCISFLFQENQLQGLKYERPTTLSSIKKTRKKMQVNQDQYKYDQDSDISENTSVISEVFRTYQKNLTMNVNLSPQKKMIQLEDKISIDEGVEHKPSKLDSNIGFTRNDKLPEKHMRATENLHLQKDKYHFKSHKQDYYKEEIEDEINQKPTHFHWKKLQQSAKQGNVLSQRICQEISQSIQREKRKNQAFIPVQWIEK